MRLLFDLPGVSIAAGGPATGEISRDLADIAPGWPFRLPKDSQSRPPDIDCAVSAGRFVLSIAGLDRTVEAATAQEAAYHLADALMDLALVSDSSLVGLHAAAVQQAGSAVLLLGDAGVGKSTIAVRLAARQREILGDDRLFLRQLPAGPPVCLPAGFAVMLRAPLPPAIDADLRKALGARSAVRHKDSLFVPLSSAPALAREIPIEACVWLERSDRAGARLTDMSRAEATRVLLDCGWSPGLENRAFVERLSGVARALPMHRLDFSDSGAAAACIIERFGADGAASGGGSS